VHIHVRDPATGKPSSDLQLYSEVVSYIRERNADLILNLTTGPGSRYVPDPADPKRAGPGSSITHPIERVQHILKLRPEICSLDVATMNLGASPIINTPGHIREIAQLVQEAGARPEMEVFELGHLEQAKGLVADGLIKGTPIMQICLGAPGGAPAQPRAMLCMRDALPPQAVWSAFGFGAPSFPMVAQAFLLGGHVRVGLEDNVYFSEGKFAAGNAELVEHAQRIIHDLGGSVASPGVARRMLGLV
jgi:uncharacterized protein (DUF849 family)